MQLTFDDGPDPRWTPRVLDALGARRASFFVLGPRARKQPELIAEMRARGHAVELHGAQHLRHSRVSGAALRADTDGALADLAAVGVHPRRWRAPWGIITEQTRELAREYDLELVGWTHDTHDWRGDSAPDMLAAIDVPLADQAIVLMHDGLGPGALRPGCAATVELTRMLVAA